MNEGVDTVGTERCGQSVIWTEDIWMEGYLGRRDMNIKTEGSGQMRSWTEKDLDLERGNLDRGNLNEYVFRPKEI